MPALSKLAALFALLAFTLLAQRGAPADWKPFSSNTGFSVMYPATRFPIGISEDRLAILSSKGGAGGIVIKHGQAQIVVMEAQGSRTATLPQVIDYYVHGAAILSRKDLHNESAGERGCSDLKEVISKEEAVPAKDAAVPVPYIVNSDFFCEVNGRKFVTLLRNWQGDTRQGEYRRVALHMAESLRLVQR
jgi:hypothetical protein